MLANFILCKHFAYILYDDLISIRIWGFFFFMEGTLNEKLLFGSSDAIER